MSKDALYFVADSLGLDLQVKKEKTFGIANRKYSLAGIKIGETVSVLIGPQTPKGIGAFVKLIGNVWAYLVVSSTQTLYIVDAKKAGLNRASVNSFAEATCLLTLIKLSKCDSITRAFVYKEKTGWLPASLSDVVPTKE
jgi:hypothetical protein